MSAALGLYRLQQTDSRMDQIRGRLNSIKKTIENDAELQAVTKSFVAAEKDQKQAAVSLKESEADVEKQNIKIAQAEASLYGGGVRNPKELQDLQMDVVSLKKFLETLEERELDAMSALEDSEVKLNIAQVNMKDVESRLKDQNKDLLVESEKLYKELSTLESERNAVLKDIDETSINTYEALRGQKRGVAVSSLTDNACSACGTTLTAAQQQNARINTGFYHCPTCGRIIYAG